MKRTALLIMLLLLAFISNAQVEYLYDFNSLTEGSQNLNGQDGWVTHYQTATSSQDFDVAMSVAPTWPLMNPWPFGIPMAVRA